jgi:low affinity Fe/Cu permease
MEADRQRTWAFSDLARQVSYVLGTPTAFIAACAVVFAWAAVGPLFSFSDTWQLVINTGTTVVTFLMVFLVQHTQNRDARALHLKLDELVRSISTARNQLIDLENCTDEELDNIEREFRTVRNRLQHRKKHREHEVSGAGSLPTDHGEVTDRRSAGNTSHPRRCHATERGG